MPSFQETKLKKVHHLILATLLAFFASQSVFAQASAFVGSWTMDVKGSNRQRAVVISQDGEKLRIAYGWKEPGAKLSLVESSLDAGGTLTMKSNADSVIVARLTDDNTMQGQFTTREGKVSAVTLVRSGATSAAADVPATNGVQPNAALAAPAAPTYLDKSAVESLIVGRKMTFLRHEDKHKVSWTVDKNGLLYGENLSQGSRDTAKWNLTDKAEFCVKWRGNSKDGCRLFSVVDGKTVMFDASSPAIVNSTVEKIE